MVLQHRCRWRQYLYRPPRVPEIQIRQQRRERGNNNLERKHFLCLFSRFPRRDGGDVYGGAGMVAGRGRANELVERSGVAGWQAIFDAPTAERGGKKSRFWSGTRCRCLIR